MRAAAFGPVGPLAPSWRVRVLLPIRSLSTLGIEMVPMPYFDERDAREFERGGALTRARLILRARRQLGRKVTHLGEDVETVFVQRHVDMASPLTWERRATADRRLVLDIDDAIWLRAPREAGAFGEGRQRVGYFLAMVTVSRLRPLARRALSTLRPVRVLIRLR